MSIGGGGLGSFSNFTSNGINLFPSDVIQNVAAEGLERDQAAAAAAAAAAKTDLTAPRTIRIPTATGSKELTLPGPLDFKPAEGAAAEKARQQYFGPTYAAIGGPGGPTSFKQQVEATAALSALPAALLGSLAAPGAKAGYKIIDKIPEALRRPFEKNFGVLVDQAMSAGNAATLPILASASKKLGADGLPASADLRMQSYGQIVNSCGETAAATILKGAGEPLSLGDVDTQSAAAGGGSLLMGEEFRRRGLSMVTSAGGDFHQLKAMVATGYPPMVSIKKDGASMAHYVVVTGYDDATGTVQVNNYSSGEKISVPYDKFEREWNAMGGAMTAVVPKRDPRLEPFLKMGSPRRPDGIHQGLTLTDFFVTSAGKVFVEGAFRHVSKDTDVTLRVNYNSREETLDRQLGGSLTIKRKLPDGWHVGMKVEKMSLKGIEDDWSDLKKIPVSVYATAGGPGLEVKAGVERGAFQASVAADLPKALSGMGFRANASVDADGSYRVTAGLSGTF